MTGIKIWLVFQFYLFIAQVRHLAEKQNIFSKRFQLLLSSSLSSLEQKKESERAWLFC